MPEIVVVRLIESDDQSHFHVDLVGYHTDHITTEPIMIATERAISLMLYERLWIKTPDGEADLVSGKCSVCGHEPYLRTTSDAENEEKLQTLTEA